MPHMHSAGARVPVQLLGLPGACSSRHQASIPAHTPQPPLLPSAALPQDVHPIRFAANLAIVQSQAFCWAQSCG
eukprot:3722186-Rhodomonas_salina.2